MHLTSNQGVEAYCFDGKSKQIRGAFKLIFNSMNLTKEQQDVILKEGPQVFVRNDALMDDLRGSIVFKNAEADCCRFVTKVTIGVVVALIAIGVGIMLKERPSQI